MRLKNVLIVVKDIDRSKRFYQDLFGLRTITDFGGNVILTEGLVLQDKSTWEQLIEKETIHGDGDMELYFEENQMDDFLKKLEAYPEPVRYLNKPMEHAWGQRVVRIYDPDGHMIEVGEAMDFVARRFCRAGMTLEEIAEKTQLPLDQVQGICQVEIASQRSVHEQSHSHSRQR
ncbi:glyoxalase [bacterium 1XD21-13]|nr:glyoxalase [bacterium 1XD21-13]